MGVIAIRTAARRAIHNQFAELATYTAPGGAVTPLYVRWHDKVLQETGDLDGARYAQVVEGADRLVFDVDAVAASGAVLKRGGQVTSPAWPGMVFTLDSQAPSDGPVNLTWNAVREAP